jgi:hypothetical protein
MGTPTNDTIRDIIVDIRFTERKLACKTYPHQKEEKEYLATLRRDLRLLLASKYANGGNAPVNRFGYPQVLDDVRAKEIETI